MNWKSALLGVLVGILLVLAFLLGRRIGRNAPVCPVEEKVDTLVIRDTISVSTPVYVTRRVVDSVLVPVRDTMMVMDTIYVVMAREQVEWVDSLCAVYASGINPQVDSVRHFVKETIINHYIPVVEVRKTRWGVGIQAGAGVGKGGLTPYVGVGVSYNLISW